MTVEAFAPIPDIRNVAIATGALIDDWLDEYLAAVERFSPDLEPRQTARPGNAKIRQGGVLRRGDQHPAVVVWHEGASNHKHDRSGLFVTVELCVLLVARGKTEETSTALVQRYVAAVRQILLQRPIVVAHPGLDPVEHRAWEHDDDSSAVDVERDGRVRAGVTLSFRVPDVFLGSAAGGPPRDADPRDDPSAPFPPTPTVLHTPPPEVIPTDTPLG